VTARRHVLIALGAVTLGSTLTSRGQQQAKVWRVGLLTPRSHLTPSGPDREYKVFAQQLRTLGYVEGTNLLIESRSADGNYERLPDLAAELVRLKVDVIVANASPAIRAAQQATTTIPIVFPSTGDPVGNRFVASLARPGGNITGVSSTDLDLSPKRLELLMAIAPKLIRVALLLNPGSSTHDAVLTSVQAAARQLGVTLVRMDAGTPEEIERGFAAMTRQGVQAVMVGQDSFFVQQRGQLAKLATAHRLPSVTSRRDYADAGCLMSYGRDAAENFRLAAIYVDKLFKGAKPADLPVEQPTKFELVINLKTAKALGLTIPQSLLLRADEVIQ
jgi:ABC-type uncharacterized transport system substrate-binding protein